MNRDAEARTEVSREKSSTTQTMAKIKNGSKSGMKLNDKSRENSKGEKKQKFAGGMEGTWFDQMLPVSKQLPENMDQKNTSSLETTNFEVSHCDIPEIFEEADNTCTQNPSHPMKNSKVNKQRKHRVTKRERSQVNEKNFEKAKFTIAMPKPFGFHVLHSNPTSSENLSIRHTQKWKMKLRTQSKRQREDIQRERTLVPTDCHMENSNNDIIKQWICQKNELLKKERETKRKQRCMERAACKRQEIDQKKRQKESEEKVKMWMMKKGIMRTQKVNDCTVSLEANASAQDPKTSPTTIDMVRKSVSQSPSKTLKSERQVTDEKLEVKQKRALVLDTGKSKTDILSSKDQIVSLCKMMSTLVQGSQPDSLMSQKSNSKTVQKNKSVNQEINEKSLPTSIPFKVAKKNSMSLSNTSQVKEGDNGSSRRRKHLIYQLPFNERLSRKAKEFKQIQAKMEEQETKLDKDLQHVDPKLANKQIQNIMDNKKNVTIAKETNTSHNFTLVSKLTDVIPNPKRFQEAMVTPAIKNWFVHRLEENTMHSADSNSSVQDDQLCKGVQHNRSSLYGSHLNQLKKD